MKILQSGPIKIGKFVIIYYYWQTQSRYGSQTDDIALPSSFGDREWELDPGTLGPWDPATLGPWGPETPLPTYEDTRARQDRPVGPLPRWRCRTPGSSCSPRLIRSHELARTVARCHNNKEKTGQKQIFIYIFWSRNSIFTLFCLLISWNHVLTLASIFLI